MRSSDIDGQPKTTHVLAEHDLPPRPGTPLGFSEQVSDMFRFNCSSSPPPPQSTQQEEPPRFLGSEDADEAHEDITHMIMEATQTLLHAPPSCLQTCGSDSLFPSAYNQVDGLPKVAEDIPADFDILLKSDIEDMSDSVVLVAPRPVHPPLIAPSPCSPSPADEIICPGSRPRFTCPPSLLSPLGSQKRTACLPPLRHNYIHRGHSRHALMQIKWFWQAREEEWAEYTTKLRHAELYSPATTILPPSRNSPSPASQSPPSPALRQHMPPMSIHPRWGDAASMRDPYCAHMDRYFVGMPMYTMRKALWMFDVHLGLERASYPASESELAPSSLSAEYSDSDDDISCEDLMSSSSFTILSDDSESTLVESENEEFSSSFFDEADVTIEQVEVAEDDDFFLMEDVDLNPTPRLDSSQKFANGPPSPSMHSAKTSPSWETNWYRRLELLLSITQMEHNRQSSTIHSA